jgi:hypothetical protein
MNKFAICLSVCLLTEVARADDGAPPPGPPPAGTMTGFTPISDRPWTLGAGKLELHGALPISGAGGDTAALLGGGVAYGASDAVQIGADYAFQLAPDVDAAGFFAGHVLFKLHHDKQMSAALGGSIFLSRALADENVLLFGVGLALRFRLTPQVSLYTDTNVCGGCINIAGPVMGQGLIAHVGGSNGGDGATLVGFTVPVGLAFQATPQVYLYGATVLGAAFRVSSGGSSSSDSAFLFNDVIPIIAGVWYTASKQLEIGASITDDLKNSSDNYFFELRARMFL